MTKRSQTDYAAVKFFTLDYIRRSGNCATYDAAEDASYLHEYLNTVLHINPYLWIGEVKQFTSDEDWKLLIRYAISLHLHEDEAEPSAGPASPRMDPAEPCIDASKMI